MILGLAFLLFVVAVEWPEVYHFAPPSTGYGSVFYALTGMHAFHVLTGLLVLLVVFMQSRRGRYSPSDYWHFVDLVWVFVYVVLYLVGP